MSHSRGLLFRWFSYISCAKHMLRKEGCWSLASSWDNWRLPVLWTKRTARHLSVGKAGADYCGKLRLPKRRWIAVVLLLFLLCPLSSFLQHLWPFHHYSQPTGFPAWQESGLRGKGTKGKRTWTRRVEEECHNSWRVSSTEGKWYALNNFRRWACPCHIFSSRGSLIPQIKKKKSTLKEIKVRNIL